MPHNSIIFRKQVKTDDNSDYILRHKYTEVQIEWLTEKPYVTPKNWCYSDT